MKRTISGARRAFRTAVVTMVLAGAPPAAEPPVMERVRQRYTDRTTIRMAFDLTIWWAVREKEEKKSGTVIVAPMDKFRVETGGNVWVSDGQVYRQYSAATGQVVIRRLLDVDVSLHPSHILRTYLRNHTYALRERRGDRIVVGTEPDSAQRGHVTLIRLEIDPKRADVRSLFVREDDGNESTYTFKKIRIGEKVADETFTFVPPEGADVLDVRD